MGIHLDRVPFYLNEQYRSEDLNILQDVIDAWIDDASAFEQYARATSAIASAIPADENNPVVLGGCAPIVSGGGLSITAGVVLHLDNGAVGPDRPLSQRCVARNPSTVAITLPSPVADTWYTVTARVAEPSDAAVQRNVWEPSTQQWIPTNLVKRTRQIINFELDAGTPTQLPGIANQMVICAIFRPAGGGAVTASQIIDLRPYSPVSKMKDQRAQFLHNIWATNAFGTSTTIAFDSTVLGPDGHLMWARAAAGINPLAAAYVDPTAGATSANGWWHLYLCPSPVAASLRIFPRHAQTGIDSQQGLLVLSKIAPGSTRLNSADITLPAPFGSYPAVAGRAVCIGSLKRNSGDSGWRGASCHGDMVSVAEQFSTVTPNPNATGFTLGGTNAIDVVPVNARAVSLQAQLVDTNPANQPGNFARYSIGGAGLTAGQVFDLTLLAEEGGFTLSTEEIVVPQSGVYSIALWGLFKVNDTTNPCPIPVDLQVNGVFLAQPQAMRFNATATDYAFLSATIFARLAATQHIAVKVPGSIVGLEGADVAHTQIDVKLLTPDYGIASYALMQAAQQLGTIEFPMGVTYTTAVLADAPVSYGGAITWAALAINGTPQFSFKLQSYRF